MSFYFVVALVANKGIIIIMHTDDRYQSVVSLKKLRQHFTVYIVSATQQPFDCIVRSSQPQPGGLWTYVEVECEYPYTCTRVDVF